jgi:hypothetical protein
MKKGKFTVQLELEHDGDGIGMTENMRINDVPPEEEKVRRRCPESSEDTCIGTICTTIILTKKPGEADPCAWIWNPTLRRWFWRCW